ECRLISHCRRHPSQKGRNLRTSLRKAEDIVNEEENIAALTLTVSIPEIFCDCETGEGNPCARSGGFVHLAEYKGGFRLPEVVFTDLGKIPAPGVKRLEEVFAVIDDAGFDHFP